jgi:hypothetical protein
LVEEKNALKGALRRSLRNLENNEDSGKNESFKEKVQ